MEILLIDQGSPEWIQARLGKVTTSKFKDVMTKGRGDSVSKTRESYLYQLASEIVTGLPSDNYVSQAMEWGKENEYNARKNYELVEDIEVNQVGFVKHNDSIGCSPDGFVNNDGLIEIKCPNTSTQISYFLKDEFPKDYTAQVQGQLWICEKEWCDFVSYDPRITTDARYFKKRVFRNEKFIKELKDNVYKFVDELEEILNKLRSK